MHWVWLVIVPTTTYSNNNQKTKSVLVTREGKVFKSVERMINTIPLHVSRIIISGDLYNPSILANYRTPLFILPDALPSKDMSYI